MPATYEPIATTTLGSAQTGVTFSSISQAYTDIIIVVQARSAATLYYNSNLFLNFNNDYSTNYNYSQTRLTGNGSTATSGRGSNNPLVYVGQIPNSTSGNSSTDRSSNIIHVMNYSNSTTNKTVLSRSNSIPTGSSSVNAVEAYVGLWRSTAAITRIDIASEDNFTAGSTFTLYGIKAA